MAITEMMLDSCRSLRNEIEEDRGQTVVVDSRLGENDEEGVDRKKRRNQ